MAINITFLGGAGTVTGSKYLVTYQGQRLLVDCGLFQGQKDLRLRNWQPLPVASDEVDAVVLTHAHLDHSGYVPLLVREGYRKRVWCTPASRDLLHILLPDSGHLQEEDAGYANRKGFSKHRPALPLYTEDDARRSLKQLSTAHLHEAFEPIAGWEARFQPAGHILGAASLLLTVGGKRILFSGDLGRPDDVLMLPPQAPPAVDAVLIESTYGDRTHPQEDLAQELLPALLRVANRGGTAVLPVFAVGRAQAVLHTIGQLKQAGSLPHHLPVYLDSPMAIHTTGLFGQHLGEHRLNAAQCRDMEQVATMTSSVDESKAIARQHGPKVILSASGMATGGRVLHHLALHLPDHRNMVILTGYQAPGTRGATLASGARSLRMHGQDVPVRAEIVTLHAGSAHADSVQLRHWLRSAPKPPHQVFVVHGDAQAAEAFRQTLSGEWTCPVHRPEFGTTWTI